jgi:hypothetical protein
LAILSAIAGMGVATAEAGCISFFKRAKCDTCQQQEECCQPKRKCCFLHPQDAPRGEIASAIPAVFRPGQAVQVSDSAVRRGIQAEAARELQAGDGAGVDDRIGRLEKDLNRLSVIVEKLDQKIDALSATGK